MERSGINNEYRYVFTNNIFISAIGGRNPDQKSTPLIASILKINS